MLPGGVMLSLRAASVRRVRLMAHSGMRSPRPPVSISWRLHRIDDGQTAAQYSLMTALTTRGTAVRPLLYDQGARRFQECKNSHDFDVTDRDLTRC